MKHHSISRILKAATPMLIVYIVLVIGAAAVAQAQNAYATIDYPNATNT